MNRRPAVRRPKGKPRYLVRAWARTPRSPKGEVLVKTMRIETDDPHTAATELYRLRAQQKASGATGWRYEVIDFGPGGLRKLGEVIEYGALVERAGSYVAKDMTRGRRKFRRR